METGRPIPESRAEHRHGRSRGVRGGRSDRAQPLESDSARAAPQSGSACRQPALPSKGHELLGRPQRDRPSLWSRVDTRPGVCGPGNVTVETHFRTRSGKEHKKQRIFPDARLRRDWLQLPPSESAVTAGLQAAPGSVHFPRPDPQPNLAKSPRSVRP